MRKKYTRTEYLRPTALALISPEERVLKETPLARIEILLKEASPTTGEVRNIFDFPEENIQISKIIYSNWDIGEIESLTWQEYINLGKPKLLRRINNVKVEVVNS